MLDPRFAPHNTHLESPESFAERDPHLRQLRQQPLAYRSLLLQQLPRAVPGIYSITGGRQIGKTTVLKQWMADLLVAGVKPAHLLYYTGELIDDHHSLVRLASDFAQTIQSAAGPAFLLIDEVTYIKEWDKGVKYLADAGILEHTVLVLTGSDTTLIREARARFPGRRGRSHVVDFHLFPLSFMEYVGLTEQLSAHEFDLALHTDHEVPDTTQQRLSDAFGQYLVHGGYLTAINDMARARSIAPATFATYCDWIRGDMLKRGKHEHYLREILGAVVRRYGTQVTWNNLAKDLSIDHPITVSDYMNLLAAMDAVFIQQALVEDKLVAAPKKARKLLFCDPFILHAVRSWLDPVADPFTHQVRPLLNDPEWVGRLAESCAITHIRRFYPTFYIKAEGEVDIAYVDARRFWPIEVKWTQQLRPKDLKQIAKYKNARIWSKSTDTREILGVPSVPLPLALLRLGASPVTFN